MHNFLIKKSASFYHRCHAGLVGAHYVLVMLIVKIMNEVRNLTVNSGGEMLYLTSEDLFYNQQSHLDQNE